MTWSTTCLRRCAVWPINSISPNPGIREKNERVGTVRKKSKPSTDSCSAATGPCLGLVSSNVSHPIARWARRIDNVRNCSHFAARSNGRVSADAHLTKPHKPDSCRSRALSCCLRTVGLSTNVNDYVWADQRRILCVSLVNHFLDAKPALLQASSCVRHRIVVLHRLSNRSIQLPEEPFSEQDRVGRG